MTMTEQPPTDEALFRAAILAQLKMAEDEAPGGALEMIESLPSELQAAVLECVEWQAAREEQG